jgi:hypothetical protein
MKFILPVPRIFGHYIFQNFNNCGKNEVPVPVTVRARICNSQKIPSGILRSRISKISRAQ